MRLWICGGVSVWCVCVSLCDCLFDVVSVSSRVCVCVSLLERFCVCCVCLFRCALTLALLWKVSGVVVRLLGFIRDYVIVCLCSYIECVMCLDQRCFFKHLDPAFNIK